jgi:hypothetical protein
MWKQLVSFWRWLFGSSVPAPTTEPQEDDRRVWVRHLCDIGTTYRDVNDPENVRVSAQVHDISNGGIKLIADHNVEPGSLLSVELPGPTEGATYRVLASVIYVNAQTDGKWALGCSFTQELSASDLQNFGAKRVPAPPSDRRNWERFPSKSAANYQRVNDPKSGRYHATVVDLSPTGIGLRVNQALEPGQLLQLDLFPSSGETGISILALVARVSSQEGNEWTVGCSFIRELSQHELKALLDRNGAVG